MLKIVGATSLAAAEIGVRVIHAGRCIADVNSLGILGLRVWHIGKTLFVLPLGFARFAVAAFIFLAEGFGLEFVPVAVNGRKSGFVSICSDKKKGKGTYSTACFGRGSSVVK